MITVLPQRPSLPTSYPQPKLTPSIPRDMRPGAATCRVQANSSRRPPTTPVGTLAAGRGGRFFGTSFTVISFNQCRTLSRRYNPSMRTGNLYGVDGDWATLCCRWCLGIPIGPMRTGHPLRSIMTGHPLRPMGTGHPLRPMGTGHPLGHPLRPMVSGQPNQADGDWATPEADGDWAPPEVDCDWASQSGRWGLGIH